MRFIFLFLSTLMVQEVPAPSIKVDVNLVNVAFIARDASGTLNRSLTKDDIDVFEDGVRQDVQFFSRSDDLPLRLALIVDASDSQDKFLKQHRHDLEGFVAGSITPRDRALLVCFGNHVRLVSGFTASAPGLIAALHEFQKGSHKFPELEPDETRVDGTALFDAIYLTATEKLRPIPGERKAIILFSDGEDNSSAHDLMDAIEAAQSANSPIYTVRYTASKRGGLTARNRYGIREMDRFAHETGAASFDASKKDLAECLRQVGEELRATYEVGYTSRNPVRDGVFRKVVIRPKHEGIVVRAKSGYYAR